MSAPSICRGSLEKWGIERDFWGFLWVCRFKGMTKYWLLQFAWKGEWHICYLWLSVISENGKWLPKVRKYPSVFQLKAERWMLPRILTYFCCPYVPSLWYSNKYQILRTDPGWVSRRVGRSLFHWCLGLAPLCWCHSPPPLDCSEDAGWWFSQGASAWMLMGGLGYWCQTPLSKRQHSLS